MDKIFKTGCLFFSIFLAAFSVLKYLSGNARSALFYFVAATGFLIVYLSYKKKR